MAEIIDFSKRKDGSWGPTPPPPPPPPPFKGPDLPQIPYRIKVVNKVTGSEDVYEKTGHIVVTASNIVLFDSNQEMMWGIPNDEAVISFERLDNNEDSQQGDLFRYDEDEGEIIIEDLDNNNA